jgi:putative MATE family efflux protein
MLVGNALQTLYTAVNTFWVGRFLGKEAMSAAGVSMTAFFVLIPLCVGLTIATTIQVSQHYGAKDFSAVRRVLGTSTLMILGVSLVLLAVGEALAPQVLRWMATPDDVMPLAVPYMRILLISLPIAFCTMQVRSALQGTGDSTTPLYFLGASLVLTAGLDPVLMFGWMGIPALGLNGTAYATIIAQILTLWVLVVYLRRRGNLAAPSFRIRDFDKAVAFKTLTIGLPASLQYSFIGLSMGFVTGIVNSFGDVNALAAFTAAGRVDNLAFMPALAFNGAVSALTGQNLGANRPDRVRKIFWWGCLLSGGVTVVTSTLVVFLAAFLLRIFTKDESVIGLGVPYLRTVGASYVFLAIMFISNGVISGSGRTVVPTIITLVSLWAVRVPLAHFLAQRMASIEGVWLAIAVSFGVSMLMSLGYYFSGRWRKGTVRPRTQPPTTDEMFSEEVGEA